MEEKRKIVFYYPDFYVGGVEMAIINLAKRIYKDYDLFFFYKSMNNMGIAAELRKYGYPINITSWPMDKRFECDIMVYCSLWLEYDNIVSFVKPKKRILWSHAMVPRGGGTKFYNLPFMRLMDEVVSVSEAADETIPKFMYGGKRKSNFNVINNILNTEEIKEKSNLEPTKQIELAKDLNICTVARIAREKGWHRIKVLCDNLIEEGIDFKWFIIGEGYFPEEVAHAHALLDKYSQVEFLDKMLNPFPIVKQMDYSALLSDFESWGLVITEAKILGVPVIATDFPSSKEQIESGKNGLIIPMKQLTEYKKYVKILLENKEKFKENLISFDYEDINKKSVEKWRELFEKGV